MIAKQLDAPYSPGERKGMVKIKHVRTIDVVIVGWRPGKEKGTVGSLILGPLRREGAAEPDRPHLGAEGEGEARAGEDAEALRDRRDGGSGDPSRWDTDRELEWRELRPELVVEITYDHTSGGRIRHGSKIVRWRDDKKPRECTLDQLV